MKKSEKQMILVLIIVAVIIIAVLVNVRNSRQETVVDNSTGNAGTSVQANPNKNGTTETEEFVEKLEDGTKLNVSEKLAQTKRVDNYEISNIQITEKNGESRFIADVKNTSNAKIGMKFAKLVLLDKEGNEITSTDAIIGDVEAGQTVQLIASVTTDFSNAYDFSIQIVE